MFCCLDNNRSGWESRELKRQDSTAPIYQNFQVIAILHLSGVSQKYYLNRTYQNLTQAAYF